MNWITIPAAVLRGEGLEPYPPSDGENILFDWSEKPDGQSAHVMAHAGDFLVDVVQIEENVVHQHSKPDDEIVVILEGVLELTDDGTKKADSFTKGQIVFIPKGWAGLYRCRPADGRTFLEVAIVPFDYFDPAEPKPSGVAALRIELSAQPAAQVFHRKRYAVEARGTGHATHEAFDRASDGILIVQSGQLTLSAGETRESFAAGAIVILPRGLSGAIATTADYRAIALDWLT